MALAALIVATTAVDGADAPSGPLRATLPLAGRTVVEHQARQAARVGASPIILLVERLPPDLTGAIDRLRADGLQVEIARSVADAADRVHPQEQLLLIADGCIAGQSSIDRLIKTSPPALLTIDHRTGWEPFELIDGDTRWAGVAVMDGALLRDTAAMIGEWDLASTLLRRAVQVHARRLPVFATEQGMEPSGLPVIADRRARLAAVEQALLAAPAPDALGDWARQHIFSPIARLAAPLLINRVPEPAWLAMAAAVLALIAAPLAALGWWKGALALAFLSGPMLAVARRLASVRLLPLRFGGALARARALGIALAAVGMGHALVQAGGGWGWWLLGLVTVAAALALAVERAIADSLAIPGVGRWLAAIDPLVIIFGLGALLFGPGTGLLGAALYALGSFGFVQHRIYSRQVTET